MAAVKPIRRLPPALIAAAVALAWLAAGPRTPDLAAAVYRAGLFARDGFALYDGAWYGGHHVPGYSLAFPAIASALGVRLTGALAAVAAAVLFSRLAAGRWGARGRLASAWLALAVCADLFIGRLTYSLGVAIALGALLALQRRHTLLAPVLAAACAAASPVAGLFLALAAAAAWAAGRPGAGLRRDGAAATVAGAALVVVGALAIAFPEGGAQPCSAGSLLLVLTSSALLLAVSAPADRALRIGAVLYVLAGIAAFVVPSPMGGNISRLGAEFCGPLLAGTLAVDRSRLRIAPGRFAAHAAAAALVVVMGFQWFGPVRELTKSIGDPSYRRAFYEPLLSWLDEHTTGPTRIEIPFTRAHWESVHVAPHYPLARGWETQLDVRYGRIFYDSKLLTAASYRAWLERNAVSYVAVPRAPLDPSGRKEARLVRSGVPYLRPVWHSARWTVLEVAHAAPLVRGPAQLVALGSDRFVLRATGAGHADVRVRWTPYWSVAGKGCARRAPGGWTRIALRGPGLVVVRTRLSLAGVTGTEETCA